MRLVKVVTSCLALMLTAAAAHAQDAGTRDEIHKQRLRSEFLLLEDARTTTWGSDFGVEGRLLTIRIPLFRFGYEEASTQALLSRASRFTGGNRLSDRLRMADSPDAGAVRDAVWNELPPFRVTLGGEGGTFNAELGAVENTLGHGALVQRYTNNPGGGFDMSKLGVVASARAKSVGGTIMVGNLLQPGHMVGFNVHGRPLEWIYGTYTNFEPEAAGNVDMYALLLSALTVGVSGAMDTQAPTQAANQLAAGDTAVPRFVPGTAGGLSGEVDVGLNHSILAAHLYGNLTGVGRTFQEATLGADGRCCSSNQQGNLFGAGGVVGGRANLFLEFIKIGGSVEYRLAGPNYSPTYFDRYYEGDRTFSSRLGAPKIAERSMARHGYALQLGAQVLKTLGFFMEMSDLVQLDPRFGRNDGQMRLGGILHLFGIVDLLGAYSNRHFTNYGRMFAPETTSMWLGEARVNLGPLNLVGRQWRTFEPRSQGGTTARDGTSVLAELVIGIL